MVAMNIKIKSPPLFRVITSTIVVSRKEYASEGIILSKSFISSWWKFFIGINGIKVIRKIEAGRRAINRLNAIDEALVTSAPLLNPFTTNVNTLLIVAPSKPGSTIRLIFSFLKVIMGLFINQTSTALRLMSRLLI